jgi:NAD(P)-dependent dehydrogenase (short-subunit alcohol dehydrogenase family)
MTAPLAGLVSLVTGASRGIGREVAHQLAQQGSTVLITGRDASGVRRAAKELRSAGDVRALGIGLDLSDRASIEAAIQLVGQDPGALDILVNNAVAPIDAAETVTGADPQDVSRVLNTNLIGPWRLIQSALPLLRSSRHPRIVNVSSGAGSHGDPEYGLAVSGGRAAGYAVSKAALNAFTSALAAELTDTQILVNAVCPGSVAAGEDLRPGQRSVAVGAASVVWAATLPADGPTGQFFRDGRPLPW